MSLSPYQYCACHWFINDIRNLVMIRRWLRQSLCHLALASVGALVAGLSHISEFAVLMAVDSYWHLLWFAFCIWYIQTAQGWKSSQAIWSKSPWIVIGGTMMPSKSVTGTTLAPTPNLFCSFWTLVYILLVLVSRNLRTNITWFPLILFWGSSECSASGLAPAIFHLLCLTPIFWHTL